MAALRAVRDLALDRAPAAARRPGASSPGLPARSISSAGATTPRAADRVSCRAGGQARRRLGAAGVGALAAAAQPQRRNAARRARGAGGRARRARPSTALRCGPGPRPTSPTACAAWRSGGPGSRRPRRRLTANGARPSSAGRTGPERGPRTCGAASGWAADALAAELAQLAVAEATIRPPCGSGSWRCAGCRAIARRAVSTLAQAPEQARTDCCSELLAAEPDLSARRLEAELRARWGDPLGGFRGLSPALAGRPGAGDRRAAEPAGPAADAPDTEAKQAQGQMLEAMAEPFSGGQALAAPARSGPGVFRRRATAQRPGAC